MLTDAKGDKGKNQELRGTKDGRVDGMEAEEMALMPGAAGGTNWNGAADEPEKRVPAAAARPGGYPPNMERA